ncbi:exported protein of unknown function [Streptomyces sp. KY75]|nr:exported protein of unknown function [Streptomyces sp. KY70]CAD5988036.1 exported protein of unknown function [Streptomyces sp. KY75]
MCLGTTSFAAPSFASAPQAQQAQQSSPPPVAATAPAAAADAPEPDHVRASALPVDERGPAPASDAARKRDYDEPAEGPGSAAPAAACDPADFTSRTGSALVQQIKASDTACVNTLFGLTGENARLAFREAQMVTVASALRDASAAYPGNGSTGVPQLVLYLRAGYYVQWYNEPAVGPYGPVLTTAIGSGLDAFFASPRSRDVTDANGEALSEAVILIDSSQENARYLPVVNRLLTGYDTSYNALWNMRAAVNNTFTVLFRGHQLPAFVAAVTADRSTADTVHSFASRNLALLGTDHAFLVTNAGRELARFLSYEALRAGVRPQVKSLLDRTSITGVTAPLWVGLAESANYYDTGNCAYFATCDLPARSTGPLCRSGTTAAAACASAPRRCPSPNSPPPARAWQVRTPSSTASPVTTGRWPVTSTPASKSSSTTPVTTTGPTRAPCSASTRTTAACTWRATRPPPATSRASSPTRPSG